MWMYLANRAFLSAASAQKGLRDIEDQGMVVLSSPSAQYDVDDGDDDASESVHLVNPSMNELMQAIHTANQRQIIITQPGIHNNFQSGGGTFRAIDNVGGVEESQPNSLTFVGMTGNVQDRIDYYPHFVREICSNVVDPEYLHRALSFDDLDFVDGDDAAGDAASAAAANANPDDVDDGLPSMNGVSPSPIDLMLLRALSAGALMTIPGDDNLPQQMAILKLPPHPCQQCKGDQDPMTIAPYWGPGYWITLAHIAMAIACHRWDL
ncbi:uncharacterized protein LOC110182191 [Drosophila serrata]|uniref:uncharacterized protein LOC110182191 n=1 Tax=Drosophila serrata TaxID=7274 RepID=UPI000A1D16FD|nr:uncharacterized protein LOC110182191 [Drosophila serrata]